MPSPDRATAPHTLYERASLLLTEFSIQNHVMLSSGQREWLIKNMVALATDYCKEGVQSERAACAELAHESDMPVLATMIRNRNTEES